MDLTTDIRINGSNTEKPVSYPHIASKFSDINNRHPDKLPVVIIPMGIEISHKKYLPSPSVKFKDFANNLRTKCSNISPTQPLYFACNNMWIDGNEYIGEIYKIHHHSDKFLYIHVFPEPYGK